MSVDPNAASDMDVPPSQDDLLISESPLADDAAPSLEVTPLLSEPLVVPKEWPSSATSAHSTLPAVATTELTGSPSSRLSDINTAGLAPDANINEPPRTHSIISHTPPSPKAQARRSLLLHVPLPLAVSPAEADHTFALLSPAGEPHVHLDVPFVPTDGKEKEEEKTLDAMRRGSDSEKGCRKYRHALQMLYPYRCDIDDDEEGQLYSRLDRVGFFSFMLFSWMTGIMWKAYKRGLRQQDLWKTSRFDSCQRNTVRLQRIWDAEVAKRGAKASFFRACWRFCRTRLIVAGLVYWLCLTLGFIGPTLFVQKIIEHANNKVSNEDTVRTGLLLVFGLFVSEMSRAILFVGLWGIQYRTCVRLRAACHGILYAKLFQLKNLHQAGSSGDMINLVSADVGRVFEAVRQSLLMIGGPILMVGGTAYSVWLLGYMAFVGAAVLILFYPIQTALSRILARLRRRSIQDTDARIHLMTEMINSIRLIKMYAWEESFLEKVNRMREEERRHLAMTGWTQSMNLSLTPLVPVIAAVITFLSHLAVGGELQPTQAFTLLTIYYSTRSAYYGMPFALRAYADCKPACERIKAFNLLIVYYILGAGGIRTIVLSFMPLISMRLACERIQKFLTVKPVETLFLPTYSPSTALKLNAVTFSWAPPHRPTEGPQDATEKTKLPTAPSAASLHSALINNISMEVDTGSLVGLCGRVGSGKSTLFHGLLGQIYVPQQAWLVNDTVRENICFGEPYEYKRYNEVVQVCSLTYDFAILPDGDQTIVGERGAMLSGGQRQRVNLARAVYSNRDIYLLDDPLSAVDASVGASIFQRCILGYLRGNGKTVLLISGLVQYLERCDTILVFRAGTIVQSGSHARLKYTPGEYRDLISAVEKDKVALMESAAPVAREKEKAASIQPTLNVTESKLVTVSPSDAEESGKQAVTMKTYARYIRSTGGWLVFSGVMLLFAINMGLNTFSSWWLSYWLSHGADLRNVTLADNSTVVVPYVRLHRDTALYPGIYVGVVVLVIVISIIRSYIFMQVSLSGAMRLHQQMLSALMGATMRFYDTTPAGRILTRLSKDIDEVDSQIPFVAEIFLQNGFYCFFAILNIAIVFPWLIIAIVALLGFLIVIVRCFRSGVRDFKRIDNGTTSPILSLAASTVEGLSTIQAYGRAHDLMQRFDNLVDINTFPVFCFHCAIRWLGVRLDFMTIAFTILIALLVVLLPEQINSAQAGLTLSFAIQMSGMFQYTVRLALETEGRFTAVARIAEYIDDVPQEPRVKEPFLSPAWPPKGRIAMDDVVLRYDQSLKPALRGISFVAEPAERIGIVGRTGSGKSSIAAALFRLVDLEHGHILIDGYDIRGLSPRTLRSRLSIIPQDPVLFAGSLRYNLDPFDQYADEEIWVALNKVNLRETVRDLEGQLEYTVTQNGANFSVGERQLLCMARALLRRSKILFMDEATASIDSRTDSLLQDTIRTAFEGCTMLTVAHRLNTVINYDKILVVSDGRVIEFDTPVKLLADNTSVFARMVDASLAAAGH
ncbi:ATP-binding cassette sub-family C member 5-like isoform X2 [Paramacrobiotus metropolitanus]|uniref:ATP-binding cassette sub-family C member 5-like isoform X2 n=1 Tax=Paramacrobiotus metropolitanus TaxID=2943436 RepID=UPI0024460219|nr:ATP-binding cassette sub-family C member 5-like isoform X2 [Paramacrobiotus metropolitanus]